MSVRRYDFHGVVLEVDAGDDRVGEAIDGRLCCFSATDGPADVRFEYRADLAPSDLERPAGDGHRVYDPVGRGDVRWFEEDDVLWLDAGDAVAVCRPTDGVTTVAHARVSDLWLLSRPLFTLPLVEALERRGLHCLHAAGVAVDGRAVLIPGTSGAGKSTLAVALASGGLPLLSDDMVFLRAREGTVVVHGFPDEIDVTEESAQWFPDLAASLTERSDGWPKHRLGVDEIPGATVADDCTPGLVLLPEVSGAPGSRSEPVGAGEALVAVTPNVLLTEPASTQAHLDALAALVRASGCHRLAVGRDFDALPELVRSLAAG